MPSIFPRLGGSKKRNNNPYANPHHPSHAPLPPKQASLRSNSQASIATQSATMPAYEPHVYDNLLAEAREAANRDPITGRLLPRPIMPPQAASETNFHANARLNRAMNAIEALGPSAERSAYLNRASQTRAASGSRYDLLSDEQKRKREEEERLGRAVGGVEFYAPERHVEEYYSGGLRDQD